MIDRFIRKGNLLWRVAATTRDPIEAWIRLESDVAERTEDQKPRYQQSPYVVTDDWERRLHEILGVSWPCQASAEFWPLWAEVLRPFNAKQVRIGRGAFDGWGDGEPGLTRAAWCLVRHLQPAHVVETGVARGFTTQMILEAFKQNGAGHLYSIDLPPHCAPICMTRLGQRFGAICGIVGRISRGRVGGIFLDCWRSLDRLTSSSTIVRTPNIILISNWIGRGPH